MRITGISRVTRRGPGPPVVGRGGGRSAFAFPHRLADGTIRSVEVHASPIDEGDRVLLFSIIRDITDDLAARQALVASEERFRTAMLSAPAGMAVVSLERRFMEVNPALCRILGRDPEWLLAHRVADVLDDPDAGVDRAMRAQVVRARTRRYARAPDDPLGRGAHLGGALHRRAAGPGRHPVSSCPSSSTSPRPGWPGRQLRFLASHDALTELVNRRELHRPDRRPAVAPPASGTNLAVLFIDLDGLKAINDTYGHAVGDAVIATVAGRLRHAVRDRGRGRPDRRGRVRRRAAHHRHPRRRLPRVAAKIHDRVAIPVPAEADDIPVTLSIGLALVEPGDDPDTALHRADTALYRPRRKAGPEPSSSSTAPSQPAERRARLDRSLAEVSASGRPSRPSPTPVGRALRGQRAQPALRRLRATSPYPSTSTPSGSTTAPTQPRPALYRLLQQAVNTDPPPWPPCSGRVPPTSNCTQADMQTPQTQPDEGEPMSPIFTLAPSASPPR